MSDVKDPEALEMLMRQRETSETLRRQMRDRQMGGTVAVASPDKDAPDWMPGETIVRYEAWEYPRGNIVVEVPSRHVEASFARIEEARTHADQLNKWLAARPAPDRRYRLWDIPPEPTEAGIVAIIDRIYDEPVGSPLELLVA